MCSFAHRCAQELSNYGKLVAFSHTVFALPFALAMAVIVHRSHPVSLSQLIYILLALVSARTAAMCFNRIVDRRIDALNPRTANRELPSGTLPVTGAVALLLFSAALFCVAAAGLGRHCLLLAPLVLAVLLFYSFTKRFTSYSHVFLGLALALAPGGVWYALTAEVAWEPVVLMAAVLLWVTGFDILYSCQDVAFDSAQNLHSIPRRFGVPGALRIARGAHLATVVLLFLFGNVVDLSSGYYLLLLLFTVILASQHLLVSASDLSRVNAAFFTRNGVASIVYFVAVVFGA